MPKNVTHGIGYVRYIKSKKDLLFSEEEVANIISKISSDRLKPSLKTHIKHAAHVKEIINSKKDDHSKFMPGNNSFNDFETETQNELIQEQHDEYSIHIPTGICPKCSVGMEIIYGKYGYYWKCPSCNFCESIKAT